ncbi:hypothetical protein V2G26_000841 [Clonostachys chloroleuca]
MILIMTSCHENRQTYRSLRYPKGFFSSSFSFCAIRDSFSIFDNFPCIHLDIITSYEVTYHHPSLGGLEMFIWPDKRPSTVITNLFFSILNYTITMRESKGDLGVMRA